MGRHPILNFDQIGISKIIEDAKAGDNDITIDPTTHLIKGTVDNKFITPKQMADYLVGFKNMTYELYHPKGGLDTLKVVGADADENTQEFITANQAKVTLTTAEAQAIYDTAKNA